MKHLCWIGHPYFGPGLAAHGWEVTLIKRRSPGFVTWDEVVAACGRAPDAVVMGDASLPPALFGVERWPCLTAMHFVDSHIHSWHPLYSRAFDLCSVSLLDHLAGFAEQRPGPGRTIWLPPWAPDHTGPRPGPKQWDLLFAGTVNPATTPGRHAFLRELGARFPGLHIARGDFGELFPKARIVLNYCERGDLNFRVFEALGTGACLLTPEVGHGQDSLFTPGRDLFTYPPGDMDALLGTVRALLADPAARTRAGENGLARIDAGHRAAHRARDYAAWLASHDAPALVAARLEGPRQLLRSVLRVLYLHFAEALPDPALRAGFLALADGRPGPPQG